MRGYMSSRHVRDRLHDELSQEAQPGEAPLESICGLVYGDVRRDHQRRRVAVRHVVLFFFSSRRRHTRCSRDWSSDVCSSDLFRTVTTTSILPSLLRSPKAAARCAAGTEKDRPALELISSKVRSPLLRNTRLGKIGRASCRERV